MSQRILVSSRRGNAVDAAAWIFPVLVFLAALLPLPLFVLSVMFGFSLAARPRAGPDSPANIRTQLRRPLNTRGPPL